MGLDAMILSFWMLSFKPDFSLSFFIFIQNFFSSSSLSAIRVVWSVYQRLLIFLLANLIPACDSSSLAFLMIYSAYKLNKQSDNIQPWCTPFLIYLFIYLFFFKKRHLFSIMIRLLHLAINSMGAKKKKIYIKTLCWNSLHFPQNRN